MVPTLALEAELRFEVAGNNQTAVRGAHQAIFISRRQKIRATPSPGPLNSNLCFRDASTLKHARSVANSCTVESEL